MGTIAANGRSGAGTTVPMTPLPVTSGIPSTEHAKAVELNRLARGWRRTVDMIERTRLQEAGVPILKVLK